MKPKLGVCYYPEHWPEQFWARDAQMMRDMGLSLVRIGEFAWERIEPSPGQYRWDWLDRAIDTLSRVGLDLILGTPTATPPRWMLDRYPDMLAVDRYGNPRKFGSRRHYCFSHLGFRKEARAIAMKLASRYGKLDNLHSWQTDNEYGCHDTVLSYSEHARAGFRKWLREKYDSVDALNYAWGNVFWSMNYASFDEIDLPNLTVTEPNPAHSMDFRRYASDQVIAFNREQCEAIRGHSNKPIVHNYMGRTTDFDHFELGDDLDAASWDSYPLGFLLDRSGRPAQVQKDFARQGDPDFQAFHHDLYRAVGHKQWGIMEQQPGPVNWAPYNPAPLPGMVRLWGLEAIAHGASFVNFFRWRQMPTAQEQNHAGLMHSNGHPASVVKEIRQLAEDIEDLPSEEQPLSDVAIVFDYASAWAWDVQPQGEDFTYFELIYDAYRALRRAGLSVDFLSSNAPTFEPYKWVLIPGLFAWNENLRCAIKNYEGELTIGPRTGSRNDDFQIPDTLPPNMPNLDIRVKIAESLAPENGVSLPTGGNFKHWREIVETTHSVVTKTDDGYPSLIRKDNIAYLCGWPDDQAFDVLVTATAKRCKLKTETLPEGVRLRKFGRSEMIINYNLVATPFRGKSLPPIDAQYEKRAAVSPIELRPASNFAQR